MTATDLRPIEPLTLEFPHPPCAYCNIDCDYQDGEWECPACGAHWPELAHLHGADRPCVECGGDADGICADDQPRCRKCVDQIRANVIDPTEPYNCARCRTRVVGVGLERPVYASGKCPQCHTDDENRAYVDRILADRRTAAASDAA